MSAFDRFDPKYGKYFRAIKRSKAEKDEIAYRVRNALETRAKAVRFSLHAIEMCDERKISQNDVLHILKTGVHAETREYIDRPKRYRESFEGGSIDGGKNIRVVVREEKNVLIITVIDL